MLPKWKQQGGGFDKSARGIEQAYAAVQARTRPGVRLVFVRRLHKLPIAADREADLLLVDPEDPGDDLDALLGPRGAIVMRTIAPPAGVTL